MTALCTKSKLWFLDSLTTIHVGRDDTRGLTVAEQFAPQDYGPPLHLHRGEDVIFHLIAGEVRFVVGGEDIAARPGDTVLVRQGTPYTFLVTSAEGARWLNLSNGGHFENVVRMVSRRAEQGALPPPQNPTADQIEALEQVCRANGIEFVGPPLPRVASRHRAAA